MPTELGHSAGNARTTPEEWIQWIREQPTTEQAVQVLNAYARQQVEAVLERAATIQRKCEQYWNESIIEEAEMHAVLEFIHREAAALRGGTG
mgnify:CR=1 FL=1